MWIKKKGKQNKDIFEERAAEVSTVNDENDLYWIKENDAIGYDLNSYLLIYY